MGVRSSFRVLIASLVVALFTSGCAGDPTPVAPTIPATEDPNVIDFLGLREIAIGASLADLTAAGVVVQDDAGCGGSRFASVENASPVFEAGTLVLIWAHPPLHTPEGVMVGTSEADARRAYPSAEDLTPPAGTMQFPGLLISGGEDRAYLLLHDDGQVQKLIVGVERYARLLFDTGYGTC